MTVDVEVAVEGRVLTLSNLDRVLWPATGTTKAELLQHYLTVGALMLPHLADRPLVLHRFPQGVDGPHFSRTRTPARPPFVRAVTLSFPSTGKTVESPVVDDLPGLVWAVNIATVEVHPFLSRSADLAAPTAMVLEVEPGAPAGLLEACEVALLLRAELDARGLASYPKTSGARGLDVHVPVSEVTYADTKALARRLAADLAAARPELVVDTPGAPPADGKVLVDWSPNDAGRSTVAPWSALGEQEPTVSVPVRWDEVVDAVDRRDASALRFRLADVPARLAAGDLFAPVLAGGQSL